MQLPDGRVQTVRYTADHDGYRATVSYEGVARHPERTLSKHHSRKMNFPSRPVDQRESVPTMPKKAKSSVPLSISAESSISLPVKSFESAPTSAKSSAALPFARKSFVPEPISVESYGTTPRAFVPLSSAPSRELTHQPHRQAQSSVGASSSGRSRNQQVSNERYNYVNVPTVPPPPEPLPSSESDSLQPFAVPNPNQAHPVEPPRPSYGAYPLTESSPRLQDTRQPHSRDFSTQNGFAPIPVVGSPIGSQNINFNDEFYQVPPSQSTRKKQRVLPANTFIPSAAPATENFNSFPGEQNNFDHHNFNNIEGAAGHFGLSPIHHNSINNLTSTVLRDRVPDSKIGLPFYTEAYSEALSSQSLRPFESDNFEVTRHTPSQYFSLPETRPIYEQGLSQNGRYEDQLDGYLPTSNMRDHAVNIFEESESQEQFSTRRKPEPLTLPSYEGIENSFSHSKEADQSTKNFIPFPTNEQFKRLFSRRPFVIDPDASVFHNQPSIIVDFHQRGTSHKDSTEGPLTAPYVVVAGRYSPNPAAKFTVGSKADVKDVAHNGIARIDAADAGNIRLSSGFLPPHLARLHPHDEIGRKDSPPTPTPVQVQLKINEHKKLPLRNTPETFGNDVSKFSPNSLTISENLRQEKETIEQSKDESRPSNDTSNVQADTPRHTRSIHSQMYQNLNSDSTFSRRIDKGGSIPMIING